MDHKLIALYEIKRQSFLLGYIQHRNQFSDALAFAYYHRIAPLLNEDIARETYGGDPFDDIYAVNTDFIKNLLKYVDKCDRSGNYAAIEFCKLEEEFGGYKANRIELILALSYIRIAGRFTPTVWNAIERNAPIEAHSLDTSFSPEDVEFR